MKTDLEAHGTHDDRNRLAENNNNDYMNREDSSDLTFFGLRHAIQGMRGPIDTILTRVTL